ncbi:MAG: DUF2281 domain-containing protein [Bacteroidetes bacterium]|nr:MAG: DUF2281 domain-containing protein [Bacteroidota bacterium]
MSYQSIEQKFLQLPENLQQEAVDFLDFLVVKYQKQAKTKECKAGFAKGAIIMADDFDEPLDIFQDYTA